MSKESFADIVRSEGIGTPPLKDAPPPLKRLRTVITLPSVDADCSFYESAAKYAINGVSERELNKLSGKSPDGSLDLHEQTTPKAHEALAEFLSHALSCGWTVVEIIHGRGAHSPEGKSVLRGKVRMWVIECGAAKGYVATHNNGATQVLLRHIA